MSSCFSSQLKFCYDPLVFYYINFKRGVKKTIFFFSLVCVWYHGIARYARITVTHRDFTEATKVSYKSVASVKITVSHRGDSGISVVIPNTH
jgi:hypothetical protein